MSYDWKKTVSKGGKYLAFFLVPMLIANFAEFYPEVSSITVGTLLTMLANWLKHRDRSS